MKFALVPVEATEDMLKSGQHTNSEWLNYDAPIGEGRYKEPARAVYGTMLKTSPNGGKVSREQLKAACDAAYKTHVGDGLNGGGTNAVARAVIEALGLEVEE